MDGGEAEESPKAASGASASRSSPGSVHITWRRGGCPTRDRSAFCQTIDPTIPVDIKSRTVTIPREEDAADEPEPVEVWPLVDSALDKIDADPSTRDAAEAALEHGDGCVILANYLNSEAKRVHEMDYRFKVPLVVLAAELAREDDSATSIYDPKEGAVYFETDVSQFSFHVYKDWTVDWPEVADEVEHDYEWSGEDNQTWALDWLMDFLDVPTDDYMV